MERTIKRELSAIQHKFDEMVAETKNADLMTARKFLDTLNKIRCPFSLGDNDGLVSAHVKDEGYILIAIDTKKAIDVLGPFGKTVIFMDSCMEDYHL